MLAATARLPDAPSRYPPIVLIHGAANSARVWTCWQAILAEAGFPTFALDLRGHGESSGADLSTTSMVDYADDVLTFTHRLNDPSILIGWSMGGLVAMTAAQRRGIAACIGLAPSTPARTIDTSKPLREGEFGPEEYGITTRDLDEQPAMPDLDGEERGVALSSLGRESRYARDERARGVVVESLPCPLLIVSGTADVQWPRQRYDDLHLPADHLSADGASHWGLVLNRRVLAALVPAVVEWILRQISDRQ